MHPVEYFTWLVPSGGSGPPQPSRFKMTRAQASAYPGAICLEHSREIRMQFSRAHDNGELMPQRVVAALPKGLPTKLRG
jgi:hypothetical protein